MNPSVFVRVHPRLRSYGPIVAALLLGANLAQPQGVGISQAYQEPPHESGQPVIAAFEGWYPNPDGTNTLLIGYYNRNLKEILDIPVGPNNHVDPGGPDRGQPTHFLIGRQWGVFTITVPKDFGDKKVTWTIVSNGKTTSVPFNLNPLYVISPFKDASDNAPPFIGFAESGPFLQGPPRAVAQNLTVAPNVPLPLTVWVADDANLPSSQIAAFANMLPKVTVTWTRFRGPAEVNFANARPKADNADFKGPPSTKFTGKAATTATFTEPGEYILEVTANDFSGAGGGGFQCCWTSAQVKVTVK